MLASKIRFLGCFCLLCINHWFKQHNQSKAMYLYTDLALWAGSVIESPCTYVCMYACLSVIKVVIVDNGQSFRVFFGLSS